ncbi:hypothetical protein FVQ98_13150 [Ottowia sp. GY511]|uniref:Uncharacterized protein n=1 Tax=Ottowia flava TaxID=2675430 RepID=A0ABW4KV57_9BURK|nr:hypothetical protein [Ottowia sp. GY511]TXK26866.1 hypothetical protein FVQ98_13150 [Ottowia sp. GY511]
MTQHLLLPAASAVRTAGALGGHHMRTGADNRSLPTISVDNFVQKALVAGLKGRCSAVFDRLMND